MSYIINSDNYSLIAAYLGDEHTTLREVSKDRPLVYQETWKCVKEAFVPASALENPDVQLLQFVASLKKELKHRKVDIKPFSGAELSFKKIREMVLLIQDLEARSSVDFFKALPFPEHQFPLTMPDFNKKSVQKQAGIIDIYMRCDPFFSTVTHLDLSNSGLKSLPHAISHFTDLEDLDLSYNQIEYVSDALRTLPNLWSLNLYSNFIVTLPDGLDLVELNIGRNMLMSLPPQVLLMENLEYLSLCLNYLPAIPEELSALPKLEEIDTEDATKFG